MSDSVRPIDGSPPGSASPGILQARTLEWVAISSSKYSSSQDVHGEAHGIPHKVAGDQMSTSSCACTVLQETSAVTYSLFAKRGARESEHAIVANLLSPSECLIKYLVIQYYYLSNYYYQTIIYPIFN